MLISLLLFFQVLVTPVANTPVAQPTQYVAKTAAQCQTSSFFAIPTWYKYINNFDNDCSPQVSFMKNNKFDGQVFILILLAVIDILIRLAGLIAVGFVLYGGFIYLTSQGEPDGVKRGRTAIINALVGLVIAIFASGVVAFIGGRLGA